MHCNFCDNLTTSLLKIPTGICGLLFYFPSCKAVMTVWLILLFLCCCIFFPLLTGCYSKMLLVFIHYCLVPHFLDSLYPLLIEVGQSYSVGICFHVQVQWLPSNVEFHVYITLKSYHLQGMHLSIHKYVIISCLVCIYLWIQYLIYIVSSCLSITYVQIYVKCANM